MSDFKKIDAYLEKNIDISIKELSRFVAQPSISAQNYGLKECAQLVADMLEAHSFRLGRPAYSRSIGSHSQPEA